jgi:hypothetical protein
MFEDAADVDQACINLRNIRLIWFIATIACPGKINGPGSTSRDSFAEIRTFRYA